MDLSIEDMRGIYQHYVEAWSPVSAERRSTLLRFCMTDACEYADPVSFFAHGPSELAAVMENFQRKTPDGYFVLDSFAGQRNRALIHWRAMDGRDAVRFPGVDAVIFGPDRKLVQISGFFEKPAGMA